ncbi:MAG: leucine-rich repeat protein, partial [Clostridia bacterium]|nr:leucine-rich repeat protein [Clostridia bacterium]
MQLYCIVTDGNGETAKSDTVTLKFGEEFKIVKQPEDIEDGGAGREATFSLEAIGTGLSYQWYYKKATASKFSAWANGTTDTLTFTAVAAFENMQLYCIVTDGNGETAKSDTVTLKFGVDEFIISGVIYRVLDETNRKVAVVGFDGSTTTPSIPKNPVHPLTSVTYTVTEIGEEAFMNKGIISIALPSTITIIRARAFKGCSSLATMTESD